MNDTLSENGGERYLGQRSFADTFLYVLTRWIEKTPLAIKNYPTLKAHRARMEADEGVRQALQRQSEKPIG
jgi:glutathione S-transferase